MKLRPSKTVVQSISVTFEHFRSVSAQSVCRSVIVLISCKLCASCVACQYVGWTGTQIPHTPRKFVGVWCGKRPPWNFQGGFNLISQLGPPTIFSDFLNVLVAFLLPNQIGQRQGHEELLTVVLLLEIPGLYFNEICQKVFDVSNIMVSATTSMQIYTSGGKAMGTTVTRQWVSRAELNTTLKTPSPASETVSCLISVEAVHLSACAANSCVASVFPIP